MESTEMYLLKVLAKGFSEEDIPELSKEKLELLDSILEKEKRLNALIGVEGEKLLIDYSDTYSALASQTGDEHYIRGFLKGYTFYKQFLEKEKASSRERTDLTVVNL